MYKALEVEFIISRKRLNITFNFIKSIGIYSAIVTPLLIFFFFLRNLEGKL